MLILLQKGRKMDQHFEGQTQLPNGCTLYWRPNGVGGRIYFSDEIGGGVQVWDTALVDFTTLLAALNQEMALRATELRFWKDQKRKEKKDDE
jgi:hypothetical protein